VPSAVPVPPSIAPPPCSPAATPLSCSASASSPTEDRVGWGERERGCTWIILLEMLAPELCEQPGDSGALLMSRARQAASPAGSRISRSKRCDLTGPYLPRRGCNLIRSCVAHRRCRLSAILLHDFPCCGGARARMYVCTCISIICVCMYVYVCICMRRCGAVCLWLNGWILVGGFVRA
jgi:hypothetical protein